MRPRRLGPALAVLLALVVAGCGGLSREGPVAPGLDVGSGNPPDVRVTFPGPVPGAGQESIVRGFVRAGQASDGAYDNARAFLATTVSEGWSPDGRIVLLADDAPPSATLLDPATVRITAQAAGTVDAEGRYTAARPGTTVTATFALATVGGEWRVSALPEDFGRWIARSEVTRLVQPYAVHYVSTSRRALVPDVRWFPADKLATRLARAQLTEVPGYLAGTTVTAVPPGARLLGDAVSVEAGVATVNLISDRLLPGEANRQNLWAQFVSTLTQDPEVTRVALAVNGVPVDLAELDATAGTLAEVGFASPPAVSVAAPVVRRGADVTVFDPATLGDAEPRGPSGTASSHPPVTPDFTRLALSVDGRELAGVDPGGDGVSRWIGTNRYEVPLTGVDVGNPAYDRRG
ncbi:MAG TPA: GerMN domain-containing protein, partial [Ornithinibacter sp.]|nr:GerMN domain-containing protein [Ornithinibacter sp.]